MFTGIVTEIGVVTEVASTPGGALLTIAAVATTAGLSPGDSVAVDGACLTCLGASNGAFRVEAVAETLARTTLGALAPGSRVDLERPLAADGTLDGHFVQGHIDGTGTVRASADEGDSRRVTIGLPSSLARYVAEKGSVAVDGVSLTVTAVTADDFEVVLIPHTIEATVLGERAPGDPVNIEVDVIAKYVARLAEVEA